MASLSHDLLYLDDTAPMRRAIEIARCGFGRVEPNPMVGAVIVSPEGRWIAEGFHEQFGGAHAEVNAIQAAGERTRGAQLYVSLEPCSHFGKTPPCADAVIQAGFRRVVIGCQDPAPHVAGRGIQKLRDAGVQVDVGVCAAEAKRLIAPFDRLICESRPWVHAKWAMTLDGRIATRSGHSKWISCEASRAWVHDLRGRVDAVITGSGTVRADDPMLTARPSGPRTALRVILDSSGESLTADCRLVRTLGQAAVLVCVTGRCSEERAEALRLMGLEVFRTTSADRVPVREVLEELGRRRCTHVLLEAGSRLMGAFFDDGLIDEVHVFLAPKLAGGDGSPGPIGGQGRVRIPTTPDLEAVRATPVGVDLLIEGDVSRKTVSADLQHA